MLYLNANKLKIFITKNIANILLFLILFGSSKTFIFSQNYIRGVLVDYTLIKISLIHIALIPLVFLYSRELKSKIAILALIFIIFLINLLFSNNPNYTFVYFFNFFPLLLVLIIFNGFYTVSQKLIVIFNSIYIGFFLLQFIFKSNIFPYIPLGFFPYKGISPNIDYFSFFGAMYALPLGNFSHSNIFAAFFSFLNIFNLKNKRFSLFFINLVLITVLSSFSAILFNLLLILFSKNIVAKLKFMTLLVFTIFFYFYYLFGFKNVSFIERINQLTIFWALVKNNFLFGLGLNNFVPAINIVENIEKRIYILQPIHNIFLLLFIEGGIFLYSFLLFLITKYKRYIKYSPYLLFIFVFGFFDHFLLTIPQGVLLLLLTILLHKSIIITDV